MTGAIGLTRVGAMALTQVGAMVLTQVGAMALTVVGAIGALRVWGPPSGGPSSARASRVGPLAALREE